MPERGFGVLHQRGGIRAVIGAQRKTRAHSDWNAVPFDHERLAEQFLHLLLADRPDFLAAARALRAQQGKGAAIEVRDLVGLREVLLQAIRHMLQQQVAGAAPEGIIDDAQALDVHDDDRVMGLLAHSTHHALRALAEQRPLGQARLRIEVRQEARLVVTLQVLQAEREVAGHLPEHVQFLGADGAGILRGQQQHADGSAVHQQRQHHHRAQAHADHQRVEAGRFIRLAGVVADELLAGTDHLADHTGLRRRGIGHVGAQVLRQDLVQSTPGNGLDRWQAGHLGGGDRRDIAASRYGKAAGLAQQFGAVANAQHQAVHAAQHAQHTVEPGDLLFLLLALACGLRLGNRASHRRREARQVFLQYIVHGAGTERRNRALLTDGAGHEYKGSLGPQLAHDPQRRHAVELGQGKIGQDDGGLEFTQCIPQRLLGFNASPCAAQAVPLQLVEFALHVHVEVFDKEHAY